MCVYFVTRGYFIFTQGNTKKCKEEKKTVFCCLDLALCVQMAHKSCNSRAVQLVHYFPCSRLFSHRVQSYQLDSCDSLDIFDDGTSYLSNGVYKQVLVRISLSLSSLCISPMHDFLWPSSEFISRVFFFLSFFSIFAVKETGERESLCVSVWL